MKKSQSSLFLWISLAAFILVIAAVVVIDQLSHAQTSSSTVTSTDKGDPAKIGWKVGEQAPDFELTTTDYHDVKLSDYRGKNVILNFWATWCGPCQLEMPFLISANEKLPGLETVLISINSRDSFDNAVLFAQVNGLKFIIPVDPRGIVASMYNIRGIPSTYFIDRNGIITSIKIGPFLSESEIIESLPVDD